MVFDEIDADALLTREQVAEALTRCGVPYSPKTLSTRACRGGGPPYRRFAKRAIYRWGDVVDWARAELGAPAHSASEHRTARGA
jgi:hypothetical protein